MASPVYGDVPSLSSYRYVPFPWARRCGQHLAGTTQPHVLKGMKAKLSSVDLLSLPLPASQTLIIYTSGFASYLEEKLYQSKPFVTMSNPNYCGCQVVHPGPKYHRRCTKKPNGHLPCHNFEPPVEVVRLSSQHNVDHKVEHVYPASSVKKHGNCPNHRSEAFWYAGGKRIDRPKTGGRDPGSLGPANIMIK